MQEFSYSKKEKGGGGGNYKKNKKNFNIFKNSKKTGPPHK